MQKGIPTKKDRGYYKRPIKKQRDCSPSQEVYTPLSLNPPDKKDILYANFTRRSVDDFGTM